MKPVSHRAARTDARWPLARERAPAGSLGSTVTWQRELQLQRAWPKATCQLWHRAGTPRQVSLRSAFQHWEGGSRGKQMGTGTGLELAVSVHMSPLRCLHPLHTRPHPQAAPTPAPHLPASALRPPIRGRQPPLVLTCSPASGLEAGSHRSELS